MPLLLVEVVVVVEIRSGVFGAGTLLVVIAVAVEIGVVFIAGEVVALETTVSTTSPPLTAGLGLIGFVPPTFSTNGSRSNVMTSLDFSELC